MNSPLVEISVTVDGDSHIHHVSEAELPVVLGRGDDCRVRLDKASVSRHHARIDAHEGTLVFLDMGSHNGTLFEGRRLAPLSPIVIEERPKTFIIDDTVHVTVRYAREYRDRTRTTTEFPRRPPTSLYAEHQVDPTLHDRHAFAREALRTYVLARDEALAAVRGALASLPEATQRAGLAERFALEFCELAHDPELHEMILDEGVELRAATNLEAETALRSVRTLAERLGLPAPSNLANIALFVDNAADVLVRLLHAFAALRFVFRSEPASAKGEATGVELGQRLLDWRNWSLEPGRWLDAALWQLLIHHQELVSDVTLGAEALMEELSPHAVERARCAHPWYEFRTFEAEYRARYAHARATLSLRFGRRFADWTPATARGNVPTAPPNTPSPSSGEQHAKVFGTLSPLCFDASPVACA